ncbi:MAG: response regulator [Burkholderiaceae bacterium]
MIPNKILFAEDEVDVQSVATLALEMIGGFTVKACNDGLAVLEQVKAFAPDLILLDVMMPGMDGPTTFEHLRADPETASIPVIFFTAKVLGDEVQRYKAMGALGVIAKPFDPMTLAEQIKHFWRLRT